MTKTLKNVMYCLIIFALFVTSAFMLFGCSDSNKGKDDSQTPDQPAVNEYNFAYTNGEIGEQDVTVKMVSDTESILINGTEAYWGTYKTENDITTITIEVEGVTYTLKIYVSDGVASLKDETEGDNSLLDSQVSLSKEDDLGIANGLWKLKINYFNGRYSESHENGYFLKISDEISYSYDGSYDANFVKFYNIGNKVYYEYVERDGSSNHFDIFYVEKAGTHSSAINEMGYADVDLIYMQESSVERYYHAYVEDASLNLEEDLYLNASTMTKYSGESYEESTVNVNSVLCIKTDGTCELLITGNDELNVHTTGVWYSLGDGALMEFVDDGFFSGYLAVDLVNYNDNYDCDGYSSIDLIRSDNDILRYEIKWTKSV